MEDKFSRTNLLIGEDNLNKLKNSKVAVFGIGGVGSYVVEALARAGIGNFIIVDNDTVSESNINRQLIALNSTIGKLKVDVAYDRIKDINKDAIITKYNKFFLPNTEEIIDDSVDYIIDCIDTITSKIELVLRANNYNIKISSCMGTGNKLDPTQFKISDIYKTSICPLAKVMRHELKKKNIKHLKVLYSTEVPIKIDNEKSKELLKNSKKRQIPGSISFVPSVAGLIIASEVVKDLINEK